MSQSMYIDNKLFSPAQRTYNLFSFQRCHNFFSSSQRCHNFFNLKDVTISFFNYRCHKFFQLEDVTIFYFFFQMTDISVSSRTMGAQLYLFLLLVMAIIKTASMTINKNDSMRQAHDQMSLLVQLGLSAQSVQAFPLEGYSHCSYKCFNLGMCNL